jgi:hypothetical protein
MRKTRLRATLENSVRLVKHPQALVFVINYDSGLSLAFRGSISIEITIFQIELAYFKSKE